MKILFDISVFSSGNENNAGRSGIFFASYRILEKMLERDDVEIYVYCKDAHILDADTVLKNLPEYKYDRIKYYCNYNKFLQRGRDYSLISNLSERILLTKNVFIKIVLRLMRKLLYIVTVNINLRNTVDLSQFDCYFSPAFDAPAFIFKQKGLDRFTLLHDTIPLLFPEFYPDMKGNHWYAKLLKQLNGKDNYFADSETTRKDFLTLTNISSTHIHTAYLAASNMQKCNNKEMIEYVKNKYNIPPNSQYMLSLCTLEPRKNLLFAIEGFINFIKHNEIKDFVYVIGGGHWDAFISILETKISNIGVYQDKIIKAGYIADEDLSVLYSASLMFAYPSLYEGFGLPVLEAMNCGVPVITSNVSATAEIAGEAAILINPNDLLMFEENIKKLYYDEELRNDLIQKGLERSAYFSWEKTASTIINEMKNVYKNH